MRGWISLVNRTLDKFTLIALETGVACFYSEAATSLLERFPHALWRSGSDRAD